MSLSTSCYEIVHFAFLDEVTLPRQTELMQLLGAWAAAQAGFIARQSYHDRENNRWTDIVEWGNIAQARAAMAASQDAPTLTAVMAAIGREPFLIGHCERLV